MLVLLPALRREPVPLPPSRLGRALGVVVCAPRVRVVYGCVAVRGVRGWPRRRRASHRRSHLSSPPCRRASFSTSAMSWWCRSSAANASSISWLRRDPRGRACGRRPRAGRERGRVPSTSHAPPPCPGRGSPLHLEIPGCVADDDCGARPPDRVQAALSGRVAARWAGQLWDELDCESEPVHDRVCHREVGDDGDLFCRWTGRYPSCSTASRAVRATRHPSSASGVALPSLCRPACRSGRTCPAPR